MPYASLTAMRTWNSPLKSNFNAKIETQGDGDAAKLVVDAKGTYAARNASQPSWWATRRSRVRSRLRRSNPAPTKA